MGDTRARVNRIRYQHYGSTPLESGTVLLANGNENQTAVIKPSCLVIARFTPRSLQQTGHGDPAMQNPIVTEPTNLGRNAS